MRPRRDVVLAASFAVLAFGPRAAGAQQSPAAPVPAPSSAAAAVGVASVAPGALYGVVYDSLARGPLAGSTVQVVRADDLLGGRAVAADAAGAFRIDSLAPGRYLVGFLHPLLDLLRVQATPRLVELGPDGGAVQVDLGVPDLAGVRAVVCGSSQAPTDSSALIVGRVRDAGDDAPVANATVVLAWAELALGAGKVRNERRRVAATTDAAGRYAVCGVPHGDDLLVSAAAPGRASGEVVLAVPPRGFVARDFTLGDTASHPVAAAPDSATPQTAPSEPKRGRPSAGDPAPAAVARGTARLTGTVRDPAGRPVRGARASVQDAAAQAVAGADGTFTLGGLPAGTRTLEVRAIGFAPRRVAVDLAAGRGAAVEVRMQRVATLDPVTVFGEPSRRLQGFLERRRYSTHGRFITAEDLERWKPVLPSRVLVGVPGVRVVPRGGIRTMIMGRGLHGPCPALVVLDGAVLPPGEGIDLHVGARQLAGVEVYPDGMFAPNYFATAGQINSCSVVAFWTR